MKRFWDTLDSQLFGLAGILILLAVSVLTTGTYPPGSGGRAPMIGDRTDVLILVAGALAIAGMACFIRSSKSKRKNRTSAMNATGKNPS